MAKSSKELSVERGKRVKHLIKKHGSFQNAIANKLDMAPTNFNAKLAGGRSITEEDARRISALFPGTRYQYIMCYDDYETENDLFNAVLDEYSARYGRRIMALKSLAELRGFEIALDSSGLVIGPSGGGKRRSGSPSTGWCATPASGWSG